MWLSISKEQRERIAAGDTKALTDVLSKCKIDGIKDLTYNAGDLNKYQGVAQLVDELLDIFKLKICLKKD